MENKKINIAEDFLSIQGEGPTVGYPSLFIRLGGCNLLCGGKGTIKDKGLHDGASWRCDSIEVWTKSKSWDIIQYATDLEHTYNVTELLSKGTHIIITGGEPMMQAESAARLIDAFTNLYYMRYKSTAPHHLFEFETNGTIWNEWVEGFGVLGYQFNVSPKLSSSGEFFNKRYIPKYLLRISKLSNSFFKFVVSTQKDLEEINEFFDFIPRHKIYLMPGASNEKDLQKKSKWLVEQCIKHNYKFSSRLQIAIWDKTTVV